MHDPQDQKSGNFRVLKIYRKDRTARIRVCIFACINYMNTYSAHIECWEKMRVKFSAPAGTFVPEVFMIILNKII